MSPPHRAARHLRPVAARESAGGINRPEVAAPGAGEGCGRTITPGGTARAANCTDQHVHHTVTFPRRAGVSAVQVLREMGWQDRRGRRRGTVVHASPGADTTTSAALTACCDSPPSGRPRGHGHRQLPAPPTTFGRPLPPASRWPRREPRCTQAGAWFSSLCPRPPTGQDTVVIHSPTTKGDRAVAVCLHRQGSSQGHFCAVRCWRRAFLSFGCPSRSDRVAGSYLSPRGFTFVVCVFAGAVSVRRFGVPLAPPLAVIVVVILAVPRVCTDVSCGSKWIIRDFSTWVLPREELRLECAC